MDTRDVKEIREFFFEKTEIKIDEENVNFKSIFEQILTVEK